MPINYAVAKWSAAGQGFQITKWLLVNSNYDMTIKNCQAIQRSCLDHESNAWSTLGSERESMVCDI